MSEESFRLPEHSTMFLKVDDLNIDPDAQRPLDVNRAQAIADNFDADAFGIPHVYSNADKFYVADGQTRVYALRLMGWNGQKIECELHGKLTKAQAAKLFLDLNNQKAVSYISKFLVRITAKDKVACAIRDIVATCGLVIDRTSRDGTVVAAHAMEDIYLGRLFKIQGENPAALKGTLDAVTGAWGKTIPAVDGKILSGVGLLLLRYGQHINLNRLIEKLQGVKGGPGGLIGRGQGKREIHGGTLPAGIAHYLSDEYNRGLGSNAKNRLAPWKDE